MTSLIQSPWIQIALALFVGWTAIVSSFWVLRIRAEKERLPGTTLISALVSVASSILPVIVFAIVRGTALGVWFFGTLIVVLIPGAVLFAYWRRRLGLRERSRIH